MVLMNREQKLLLAKLSYRDISRVIDEWEKESGFNIYFHWDECISVDDELFHARELKGET